MSEFLISAKNLGELARPEFCPRCFWLKTKVRNKLQQEVMA